MQYILSMLDKTVRIVTCFSGFCADLHIAEIH